MKNAQIGLCLAVIAAVLVAAGCQHNMSQSSAWSAQGQTRLIWGFEEKNDNVVLLPDGDGTTEKEAVTEGSAARRLSAQKSDTTPGVVITDPKILAGWKGATAVLIDINNMSKNDVDMTFRLEDNKSKGDSSRVQVHNILKPGPSTIKVPFAKLVTPDGKALDLDHLTKLQICCDQPKADFDMTFDNLRLQLPGAAMGSAMK